MQIICVSRGSYGKGKELTEKLAANLGYDCMSREELVDLAAESGIPAGKLEMSVIKPMGFTEKLDLIKDHYIAFATSTLCERALKGNLVYHGRTGHLLLPGIQHIMRLRVIADFEARIISVMQRLNMDRKQAKKYIEQVDDDRKRWARLLYNVDWDATSDYDIIVNLAHMNLENTSSALCSMAQLPDFHATPADFKNLENLYLAARCRIALAKDDCTSLAKVKVVAEKGTVSVNYLPRQAKIAKYIPDVVKKIQGVKDVHCTMAHSNILWIQEQFDSSTDTFKELVEIADKWSAAIELLRTVPDDEVSEFKKEEALDDDKSTPIPEKSEEYNGGIEDDFQENVTVKDDKGMYATHEELIKQGRAGGSHTVSGSHKEILNAIDRTAEYSLVVLGDIFIDKVQAVRKRKTREMASFLSDNLKIPVIQAEELKAHYLFGLRHLLTLIAFLAFIFITCYLVFTHQVEVLSFISVTDPENVKGKLLSVAVMFIFVPMIAFIYGNAVRYMLKLIEME